MAQTVYLLPINRCLHPSRTFRNMELRDTCPAPYRSALLLCFQKDWTKWTENFKFSLLQKIYKFPWMSVTIISFTTFFHVVIYLVFIRRERLINALPCSERNIISSLIRVLSVLESPQSHRLHIVYCEGRSCRSSIYLIHSATNYPPWSSLCVLEG